MFPLTIAGLDQAITALKERDVQASACAARTH
jgi:hypothetical protein